MNTVNSRNLNAADSRKLMEQALRAVEQANGRIRELEQQASEPIAIVGIGCRFPGDCDTPDTYFERLCAGMDAVGEVPPERWSLPDWWDSNPATPGRMYSRFGAFLSDVERFDAAFFGVTPREAARMDPQHRMLLEVAWHAMEAANIRAETLNGKPVGVFLGITGNDYGELLDRRGPEEVDAYYLTGNSLNFAAGRLAYVFGFQGPAMAIDTACSSSLVAVHLAVQSLRARESEVALAAGVNAILSPKGHVLTSKARMLSPSGRCRTFDAGADGIVRGEGCGVLVLKRLSDARRDGDPIVALVLGTATGQDGASAGLTVPSKTAQACVIRTALANARVDASAIDYVECHGTGTPLGDPIEVRALASVLCADRDSSHPLLIGSVKTNVGHLESASGIAGLIKAAIAVQRSVVPAHLHLQRQTPHVDWDQWPLLIPRETMPWPAKAGNRLAGVSSFGASGTNAHVIVGQAPGEASLTPAGVQAQSGDEDDYSLLLLSARSEPALSAFAESCRRELEAGKPLAALSDVLLSSRTRHPYRTVVIARSSAEAAGKLRQRSQGRVGSGIYEGHATGHTPPRIAGLFTGQGAVYAGMGRDLFAREPVFRRAFERCEETLRPLLGWSLSEAFHTASDADLIATGRAQPLLFALQCALVAKWRHFGIDFNVVVGHSVGEIAAAYVAGIVSFEDACRWVAARAQLMQASSSGGAMLAVQVQEVEARDLAARIGRCELAVMNGRSRSVLAGDADAIAAVESELLTRQIESRRLRVSHAFHSSHMDRVLPELGRTLASLRLHPPKIPLISAVTGEILDDASAVRPEFWTDQVRKPVRFAAAAERLAQMDLRHTIELGPHPQLLETLAEDHPGRFVLIPSLRRGSPDRFVQMCAAGVLMADGIEVNLPTTTDRRSVAFPLYPFEPKHHSLGVPKPLTPPAGAVLAPRVFESWLDLATFPALAHHRIGGAVVVPASFWVSSILERLRDDEDGPVCLGDIVFERALVLAQDERRRLRITVDTPMTGLSFRIETCPFAAEVSKDWTVHARGSIRRDAAMLAHEPVIDLRARCSTPVAGDVFHRAFAEVGIELGSHFSWIRDAWLGPGEALARFRSIQSPDDACYGAAGWPPGLLDSLFQLLGGALESGQRSSGVRVPYLLESLRASRYSGTELFAHAKLRVGSSNQWLGDLRMWSEDPATPCDVEVRGLHLKPVTLGTLQAAGRSERDATWDIRWQAIAQKQDVPYRGSWVIVGNHRGLAGHLNELLTRRGQKAICIQTGENFARIEPALPTGEVCNPQNFSDAVGAALMDGLAEPAQVVYVADEPCDGDTIAGRLSLDAVYTLRLVKDLLRGEQRSAAPRLWLITRDAVIVDGERTATDGAAGAALWGLGRALALEHPELQPTLIDLTSSDASAEEILRAIDGAGHEDQLAVRGHRLLARRLVPPRPEERLDIPEVPFKAVAMGNTIADLAYRTCTRRAPEPDEVEIGVSAVGLNFRDVLAVLGVVPSPNGALGAECAGRVTAVGSAVSNFRVGDRVLAIFAKDGALASHTLASAHHVRRIPANLTDEEAVTLPVAFLTALYGLRDLGGMKAGQRVLLHAGAGGVGQAAVQVARKMGLKVVATAGSTAKRALLERQGVEATFDSRSSTFAPAIRDAGLSIDAVLGAVTGEIREESVRLLVRGGSYLEMGKRDLLTPERAGASRYTPFDIIELGLQEPSRFRALLDEVMCGVRENSYQALPFQCFPAARLREAFTFFAQGKNVGKVVISLAPEQSGKATFSHVLQDAAYVITGGFGGLGLATADWLVSRGAKHIVLMGRTGAEGQAIQRIHGLQERGATVLQLKCDVADSQALETAWTLARSALPPVRGIFHAAGILRDGLATNALVEDCEAVLRPKVTGALNLVRVFGDQPLDHFVLYSSAAAVFGSPGQTAYALANSALSRLAHTLRAEGIPAIAVNFGPWSGAGMAQSASFGVSGRWKHLGLRPLSCVRAFAALEHAIETREPECVICDLNDDSLNNADLPPTLLRLFDRRGDAGNCQGAVDLAGIAPAERADFIRAQVRHQVLRLMGLGPDDSIDESVSLGDLGLDSLMSIELKNALAARLGLQLPVSVLAERPSLSRLFALVLELIPGVDQATGRPVASTSLSATPANAPLPSSRSSVEVLEERMAPLRARLDLARSAGAYYFETPLVELDGPQVTSTGGERKIMFATYSYLGLLGHPRIGAAAEEAIRKYGTGTHGVRLNGGTLDLHKRLESRIAGFLDREAAITFSSGFMTNVAVIGSLVRPGDWVISDQWNHASIVDGCNASGGVFRVFPHADLDALERILDQAPPDVLKLVISDAVFSLDGDVMDLQAISACCRRHGALLMVDEAHSIGILGTGGRGIEDHFGAKGAIDVCMGTLSKTIPAVGGFVAGSERLIEFLRFTARGYVFSAAMPPAVAAAALAAFDVLEQEGEARQRALMENVTFFLQGLRAAGLDTGRTTTAIIPVIVGSEERALALTKFCHERGIFAMPVLPPAVPMGTARLRLNVMATHTRSDLERALAIIVEGSRQLPLSNPTMSLVPSAGAVLP